MAVLPAPRNWVLFNSHSLGDFRETNYLYGRVHSRPHLSTLAVLLDCMSREDIDPLSL
jgi:hypothetical protein